MEAVSMRKISLMPLSEFRGPFQSTDVRVFKANKKQIAAKYLFNVKNID